MNIVTHLVNKFKAATRDVTVLAQRSAEWPAVEKKHLHDQPCCAACGSSKNLNVHHKKPFHLHPELELDPSNLITLCMDRDCHLLVGHGDNFKMYNPNVEQDAKTVSENRDNLDTILKEVAVRAKQNRLDQ